MEFNLKQYANLSDVTKELTDKVAASTEESILSQLNYLISKGLLEVEHGPLVMTEDTINREVKVSRSVTLSLKDQEYIEKLERENDKLIGENLKLKEMIKAMVDIAGNANK